MLPLGDASSEGRRIATFNHPRRLPQSPRASLSTQIISNTVGCPRERRNITRIGFGRASQCSRGLQHSQHSVIPGGTTGTGQNKILAVAMLFLSNHGPRATGGDVGSLQGWCLPMIVGPARLGHCCVFLWTSCPDEWVSSSDNFAMTSTSWDAGQAGQAWTVLDMDGKISEVRMVGR